MDYGFVIYDWNGTLLDDTSMCHDMLNELLHSHGLPAVSMEKYRQIFTFPIKKYYERAGFDFSKESYEHIADGYVRRYMKRYVECSLTEGALDFIRRVTVPQFIVSATKQEMLDEQVDHYGIRKYFTKVMGLSDHYAGGKVELAKKCAGMTAGRGLWIGDTTHDYESAKAIGCDCVLLESGHQSPEILKETGCRTVSGFSELMRDFT